MTMYKIEFNNFFSYSFSIDCVIFGYRNGEINVLLIKRSMEPFKQLGNSGGSCVSR